MSRELFKPEKSRHFLLQIATERGGFGFHFANGRLRYVSQTLERRASVGQFFKMAEGYAESGYLLTGVFSLDGGLLYDVFKEAHALPRERGRNYWDSYEEARILALAEFERRVKSLRKGGNQRIHLLFAKFDKAAGGGIAPRSLVEAYSLMNGRVEMSPSLTWDNRVNIFYAACFDPLLGLEQAEIWGPLRFGMGRNEAIESLASVFGAADRDVVPYEGSLERGTRAVAVLLPRRNWALELFFSQDSLFAVNAVPRNFAPDSAAIPWEPGWQGAFVPYMLTTRDGAVAYDIFADESRIRDECSQLGIPFTKVKSGGMLRRHGGLSAKTYGT